MKSAAKKNVVKSVPAKAESSKAEAAKSTPAKSAARGLGRGLSSLMSETYSQSYNDAPDTEPSTPGKESASPQTLKVTQLQSGKYQPRGYFDGSALNELANSIAKSGVMQPILVRPIDADRYEIIAGERRWRAAKMVGLTDIPVLIREMSDEQALEMALVENVQREGLHPLEEAAGYQRLMNEFGYTQENLAQAIQKSRSHIANLLRLQALPKEIRNLFAGDKLTMGHARALMGLDASSMDATALAHEIVRRELSVRQTEKLIRDYRNVPLPREPRQMRPGQIPPILAQLQAPQPQAPAPSYDRGKAKDPDILALEETLSENLGLKVSISDRGQSGEIMIAYESLEQLDEILRRLGGSI